MIEILVVVALLSVIILGLMAMFNQTQRAFRLGMSQTDVLGGGRLVTDMLAHELAQVTPSRLNANNFNSTNFYAGIIGPPSLPFPYAPLLQSLPGSGFSRTNVLEDLFFVTRQNQTWTGIGYFVRLSGAFSGRWGPVGTLYRVESSDSAVQFQSGQYAWSLFNAYQNSATNVSKILDGVVHFRVRTYDTNGVWIAPPPSWVTPPTYWYRTNIVANPSSYAPGEAGLCVFRSNAVPAYVEVEVGILEQQTLERYQSIPNATVQMQFLKNQAGHVHLFRQRIPVRTVDPSAYQ